MNVKELIAGQAVVTARLDQTLGEVAALMARHHVTGVPIVDEWGCLAGLVTVSRIIELAREHGHGLDLPLEPSWSPTQRAQGSDGQWHGFAARDAMVSDLVTVTQETSVREAARALLDGQVHRAVVLGPDRNVCGVVSTMDFTRLVAERSPS